MIEQDKLTELEKHIEGISADAGLLMSPLREVPNRISMLARMALNIEPEFDIADMSESLREEVLFITREVRNNVIDQRNARQAQAANLTVNVKPSKQPYFVR